ncbi:hypothetical protein GCM10027447_31540 [Glycomyces halotolerans]
MSAEPLDDRPVLVRRAEEDAAHWEARARDPSHLYRGAKLAEVIASVWPGGDTGEPSRARLTETTKDFLYESAARARGRERRTQAGIVLCSVLALVAAAAFGTAVYGLVALDGERDDRLADQLVERSDESLLTDSRRARLLAAAAWEVSGSDAAWAAMARSVDAPATGQAYGHDSRATDVAFSPDGTAFASGAQDGSVAYWSTDDWTARSIEPRLSSQIQDLEFSPDGRFLAAGAYRDQLVVWNVDTGEVTEPRTPNSTELIAYSPDATRLATAGTDGVVTVWSLPDLERIALIPTSAEAGTLSFSRDGDNIVVGGSGDGLVRSFDAATGEPVDEVKPTEDASYIDVLRPAGFDGQSILYCASFDCIVQHDTGAETVQQVHLHGASAPAVATFDGDLVIASYSDLGLGAWDTVSGRLLKILPHTGLIEDVAISPDGSTVIAATDGPVQRWSLELARPLESLYSNVNLRATAYTADGRHLVGTGLDGTQVWGAWENGAPASEHPDRPGLSLAAAPEGAVVATGLDADEAAVEIWDAGTGEVLDTLSDTTAPVTDLTFNAEGTLLATGTSGVMHRSHSETHAVVLWDTETGEERLRLDWDPELAVYSLAFSPDGELLATVDQHGASRLWDTATGELVAEPHGPGDIPTDLRFGNDGQSLIAASGAGMVEWLLHELEQPPGVKDTGYVASALAISPDGDRIAVYEQYPDGEVGLSSRLIVWDVERDEIVAEFPLTLSLFFFSIDFAPDGRTIVASDAATITKFDLGHLDGDLHRTVCEQTPHRLDAWEWDIYLPEVEYGSIDMCPED